MKKLTKHLAAIAMALAVAVTALVPVKVEAAPSYDRKVTVYHTTANTFDSSTTYLRVGNLNKSDTIKKSSVKSSNQKSVKLCFLQKSYYGYDTEYFSSGSKGYSSKSYSYYIGIELLKPGKSTVSFKIGDKKYNSTVTVAKYENPLKKATIFGKNYASKLDSENEYKELKVKSTQKNQTFAFEANKNWKITSVEVDKKDDIVYECGEYYGTTTASKNWLYSASPKSKVTLGVGNIEKNKFYQVRIDLTNTKTGGNLSVYYDINYINKRPY